MFDALLALVPILLIIFLMIGLGWSAARAAAAGLGVTIPIALFVFGFGMPGGMATGLSVPQAFGGAALEAGFTAATILWIIFPALCVFELLSRQRAFDALKGALGRLSDDPRVLAILVAWFFGLFLEGAAGFGTPVALAAPILVSLGFSPIKAVTLALVGHAAGVSFGAIGTPVFAQVAATGLPAISIAGQTALLHVFMGLMLLVIVYRLAAPHGVRGVSGHSATGPWTILLGAVSFFLPFYLLAVYLGPELPTLLGALAGGMVFAGVLSCVGLRELRASGGTPVDYGGLWRSALPYVVLILLIMGTRLIEPIQTAAQSVVVDWRYAGEFSGVFQPLYHPGTLLMAGFVIGGLLMGCGLRELLNAAVAAARRMGAVIIALVLMLTFARVMVHAGMIAELAEASAIVLGQGWPLLAPGVGVLGSFVTGSATASNILFTDFQVATAQALDLPVLHMVAAQGFGAAIGNMVCPHNVIAGAATVGIVGREGEVLRRTALVGLACAAAGGVVVFALVAVA